MHGGAVRVCGSATLSHWGLPHQSPQDDSEGPIDLLVSDVVMPEVGGRELAEGALKLWPGLKVLFMSGYTQDVVLKEGVQKGSAFLQKPFTPAGLAQKVRETLDSAARSTAPL